MIQVEKFVVTRFLGAEDRTERRLRARALNHLKKLENLDTSNDRYTKEIYWDECSDILNELSFTVRRLAEIAKEVSRLKGINIGYQGGKLKIDLWNVLQICTHLQTLHVLGGAGGLPNKDGLMFGAQSDERSVGVLLDQFIDKVRDFVERKVKPQYGLVRVSPAPSMVLGPDKDSDGYPILNFLISSRKNVRCFEDFFWGEIEDLEPGHPNLANFMDLNWLSQHHPYLKNDEIFLEVLKAESFCADLLKEGA
ncbi:MAG: hypothetical protein L3J33_09920 [Rhodobacteraceae bacterium]|nr:hypothetical protein [Paracoccaceae bacterium]